MQLTPQEFADRYLQPYKTRKGEATPKFCPFCDGGQHNDKYTFYLNLDDGAYYCHRGKCGVKGSFYELLKEFNEEVDKPKKQSTMPRKSYKPPKKKENNELNEKALSYLKKRGFSERTLESWKIKSDKQGNIVYPYYNSNNKLTFIKYRKPIAKKENGNQQIFWREKDTKPIFWGMDRKVKEKLVICEGENDCLALVESGVEDKYSITSVPSGSKDLKCIDYCWDWLMQFEEYVIWPDQDEAGLDLKDELVRRLGNWQCTVVESPYKDANEHLYFEDKASILEAIEKAQPIEVGGVVPLVSVKEKDLSEMGKVTSTIPELNKYLGGYLMSSTSLLFGDNGSGKSTFLGQELTNAINQDLNVLAFSGELPDYRFKAWVERQIAGRENIETKIEQPTGRSLYKINDQVKKQIQNWYAEHLFIYDSKRNRDENSLLETFRYAASRYNVRLFIIDNLIKIGLDSQEPNYYLRQAEFVERVYDFSKEFDVHTIVVTHPRKTESKEPRKEDVSGHKNLTDLVDTVIGLRRIKDRDREEAEGKLGDCDSIIYIIKNRILGEDDIAIKLNFEKVSKRFESVKNSGFIDKNLGWRSEHKSAPTFLKE